MKQNEAVRWPMILLAGACLILGLAGITAMPVLMTLVSRAALGPVLFGGMLGMLAGVGLILRGVKILENLSRSKTNEPPLGDSLAASSSLSPADAMGLTVHTDRANSLVSEYRGGVQVQVTGVTNRLVL